MRIRRLIEDVTEGLDRNIMLRLHYQRDGFGLESAFEREAWARARIAELREKHGLTIGEIRLVKHISSRQSGQKVTWQVHAKEGKGVNVAFIRTESKESGGG